MFYTPEPTVYAVFECPAFATNEQLADLLNEHLPNPDHHREVLVEHEPPQSSVGSRVDFVYDESGTIEKIQLVVIWGDEYETYEYVSETIWGGRYVVVPCTSLWGPGEFSFVDNIDAFNGKPLHPYTDIYVTL